MFELVPSVPTSRTLRCGAVLGRDEPWQGVGDVLVVTIRVPLGSCGWQQMVPELWGPGELKMLRAWGDKLINVSWLSSGSRAGKDVSDRGFTSWKRRRVTPREFSRINASACPAAGSLLNVGSRASCIPEPVGKGKP